MSNLTELPEDLTSHEDFPAEVAARLAERDATVASVDAAERAYLTAMRETRAEAEEEARLLTRAGTMPELHAADGRTARVARATREVNSATRARDAAARRYADALREHGATIEALAHRVALASHADVLLHGEALLAALRTREAAYEAAGRPGEHTRTLTRGGWVEAYWLRRPDTRPAMTLNGIRMPELRSTLDGIADVLTGFPVDEIKASAAEVGR